MYLILTVGLLSIVLLLEVVTDRQSKKNYFLNYIINSSYYSIKQVNWLVINMLNMLNCGLLWWVSRRYIAQLRNTS